MRFVFTPDWFLAHDVLIESFSFIVLFIFFLLSIRSYKINKKKSTLYLGIAFLFIAVAELAVILTKTVLYYDTSITQNIGRIIITYHVFKSTDILYRAGFFINKLLTLLGLYIIYRIPQKKNDYGDLLIAMTFIIIASIFSSPFYYIFHIAALILIILIIKNYYKIYKQNKMENTKILIAAFVLLAISQLILILSPLPALYALAQCLQLVSYLILLILVIRILKTQSRLNYGKKTNKNRYNK